MLKNSDVICSIYFKICDYYTVRNIIENRENNESTKVLKNENVDLKNKVSIYENSEAKAILINYKGKAVDYYENGIKLNKVINTIEDVYFVIMKSFKTN